METTTNKRTTRDGRALKKSVKGNPSCCLCNKVFPMSPDDRISYVSGPDRWDMCYKHIADLSHRPDSYFPPLPTRMARNFDLATYLNETAEIVNQHGPSDPKWIKTWGLITELLNTKLSVFIGDVGRFAEPNRGLGPVDKNVIAA